MCRRIFTATLRHRHRCLYSDVSVIIAVVVYIDALCVEVVSY
jgi:hypothetical protein